MVIFVFIVVIAIVAVFLLTALIGAPYVPTQKRELKEAFDHLRPLTHDDVVLDIGSGDGAVLKEVVAQGAYGVGYELNIFLVWISRRRLHKSRDRVRIELKNLWTASFPDATTLVYTFGESRDIEKMYKKVQSEATRLGRPLELLSYGFAISGKEPVRQHRAHFLYEVAPLHLPEPQV